MTHSFTGDDIEAVARKLMGDPNPKYSTKQELRFGNKGSLSVEIDGENAGCWFDHEAKEGGGVLELLRARKGLVNGEALDWLCQLGIKVETQTEPGVAATYDYTDAAGKPLFQVVRYASKKFVQRRRGEDGQWIWGLSAGRYWLSRSGWRTVASAKGDIPSGAEIRQFPKCPRVPYRLPELIQAVAEGKTIWIPEGEKDVDKLRSIGLTATCNPGGAKNWLSEFRQYFRGADVVILPDNDETGREHGQMVENNLREAANQLRKLDLPDLPDKGDVSDWIKAGGTAETLERLAKGIYQNDTPAEPANPVDILDLRTFQMSDLDRIPPRPWILGTTALRGAVTAVSAPGGTSKSTLELERCIAVATGIPITGEPVHERARAWYLSAEDPWIEVMRRVKAICLRFDIDPALLEGWLFIHDLSNGPIQVAARAETRIVHPDTPKIAATVEHHGIGYIVLDPLVSFHALNENDNVEMATVIRSLSGVAQQTGCAIKIIAHARKGHLAGDTDTMRGASAIRDGCRIVETLTTMTEDEAAKLNVDQSERRWLVRLDDAKANFAAPADQVTWFRRESVDLDNSDGTRPSDKVGVLRPFDISALARESQRQAEAANEQANVAIAEMIAGTITGTEMPLKDAADALAVALGRSGSVVRDKIAAAIPKAPAGRDVVIAGERIRLWIRRDGTYPTAPQTIVKQVIHD
jgi:hypothetical protein